MQPEDLPYSGEGEAAAHLEPRNGWVSLRQDTVLLLALAKQGPMRLGADDLRLRSPEQHDQFWRVSWLRGQCQDKCWRQGNL